MLTPDNIPTYAALRNAGVLFKALSIVCSIICLIFAIKQYSDSHYETARTLAIIVIAAPPVGILIGQMLETLRDIAINSWHQRMLLEKMHHELTRPPSEESRLFRP